MKKSQSGTLSEEVKITVPINRSLLDGAGGDTEEEKQENIKSIISKLLDEFNNGALLVTSSVASKIKQIAPVKNGDDLLTYLEQAVGRRKGRYVFQVEIDPSFVPAIEGIAKSRGEKTDKYLQDCINYIISMGWLFEVYPAPFQVRLSDEQVRDICNALGIDRRELNGQTLYEKIMEVRGANI